MKRNKIVLTFQWPCIGQVGTCKYISINARCFGFWNIQRTAAEKSLESLLALLYFVVKTLNNLRISSKLFVLLPGCCAR